MAKKRFWIGILALLVGVVVAHIQTRRSASIPAPKPSTKPAEKVTVAVPPAPRPTAKPTLLPIEPSPSEPMIAALEPITPSYAPEAFSSSCIVPGRIQWRGVQPIDRPTRLTTPLQDNGKLWVAHFDTELARADAKGDILSLLDKKPADEDPLQGLKIQSANVGTTYPLMKSDDTTFMGQFAGGFSRDYNGLKDGQQIPEVVFGFQFEHEIDKRNKLLGSVEFGRDVVDHTRSRVRTQAAWEVLIDPEKNVSLRTGVLTRADTTPTGEQSKNVDCSLDLIWKF